MLYQDEMAEVNPSTSQREPYFTLKPSSNLHSLLSAFGEVVCTFRSHTSGIIDNWETANAMEVSKVGSTTAPSSVEELVSCGNTPKKARFRARYL